MDAIALYTIYVNAKNQLVVTLKSEYSAGSIDQHMGYVISGTTRDGVYLEICDLADGHSNDGTRSSCAGQQPYKLNTPLIACLDIAMRPRCLGIVMACPLLQREYSLWLLKVQMRSC